MKKKIYISLPIAHYEIEERRKYAQNIEDLLSDFFDVTNPLKNGLPEDADWREHMRVDIQNLLQCDRIFMCKEWENSHGCKLEHDVATSCGLGVIYETRSWKPKKR